MLMPMSLILMMCGSALQSEIISDKDWTLVWSDEFNGENLDMTKWSYQTGTGSAYGLPAGWGNNELQFYTQRRDNVFIKDGRLYIRANREEFKEHAYTSARIRTALKGDWLYGKFEISAKLPKGQGIWPAIWMLPTEDTYGSWAASGEIDIVELIGQSPATIHGFICHGGPWPRNKSKTVSYSLNPGDFSRKFYRFTLIWEPQQISWYVDDVLYACQSEWSCENADYPAPFDQKFYLLLNVAVGGNWPKAPDETTQFPVQMEVEYVKVFQRTSTLNQNQ